jgi:hypothetical protein
MRRIIRLRFGPRPFAIRQIRLADLITGEVSFVEAEEFGLRHVPEPFTLRLRNAFLRPGGNARRRCLPVHLAAYDFAHDNIYIYAQLKLAYTQLKLPSTGEVAYSAGTPRRCRRRPAAIEFRRDKISCRQSGT